MKFKHLGALVAAVLAVILVAIPAQANIKSVRWVNQLGLNDDLQTLLTHLNAETGLKLQYADFSLFERRDLAHERFSTYFQTSKGIPIQGALIRTWVDLETNTLTQLEATLDDASGDLGNEPNKFKIKSVVSAITSRGPFVYDTVAAIVRANPDDPHIGEYKFRDMWVNHELQRLVTVKAQHGTFKISVSLVTGQVVSSTYEEFPQFDIDAMVYPIYEETAKAHKLQTRVPVTLTNLREVRKATTATDPFAPLQARHYYDDKVDLTLAETVDGQAAGFWSLNWLMRSAKSLFEALPWQDNSFKSGGVFLEGTYATVSLHPAVRSLNLAIPLTYSGHYNLIYKSGTRTNAQGQQEEVGEIVPSGAVFGQALARPDSALARVARRLPDHNMVSYINDGFDEIQVYYAINQLMTSLHNMGFSDPELSTRAFNAFLYDPDISMQNNAYYQNDTINFTTYSGDNQNFARDNSTIWHELGHGVMDRLMGDLITLADSGGLSEGMADFVAQLIVQDVSHGAHFDGDDEFRIVNKTGFNLTNEAHDDGEAYGGTMKDIMDLSIAKFGRPGLVKMTDLTLETMRLARNHPALTANDWFEHMMFADSLGSEVRAANEMHGFIVNALNARNFRLDRGPVAKLTVMVTPQTTRTVGATPPPEPVELTNVSKGSRNNPYTVTLAANEEASFGLNVKLTSSDVTSFHYPVTVKAEYTGGALEGPVHWRGEENGPQVFVLKNETEVANLTATATAKCDAINRPDGSCSDYVYIRIFNNGETRPVAKKRFYVRVKNPKAI